MPEQMTEVEVRARLDEVTAYAEVLHDNLNDAAALLVQQRDLGRQLAEARTWLRQLTGFTDDQIDTAIASSILAKAA